MLLSFLETKGVSRLAREILLQFNGKVASFGMKPLERSMIYGKRKREYLDQAGKPCSRGSLLDDGSLLLRAGMSAQSYFLPNGESVKSTELEAFDSAGNPITKQPSTLGVAQPLQEAKAEDCLNFNLQSIYMLEPQDVPQDLKDEVTAGKIFRFSFNYREDFEMEVAYLLANDSGFFALIGKQVAYDWITFESAVDLPPDEFETEEDLDFELL